jgi:ubiquinone biosynthesis accessory factor UbiK
MNTTPLDELVSQVLRNLPAGLQALRADVERNIRATLEAGLRNLDLVTRQEFEVQQQLLQRAQLQMKVLEEKLTALEALIKQQ